MSIFTDHVKWAIRMPTAYAVRQENLDYLPEIKAVIEDYVYQHFSYNITDGSELDVEDMTLGELKTIYRNQSDKVREMQASGELTKLHEEFAEVESAYNTSHLKIMDALDRAEVQITQAEDEINRNLYESDARVRLHKSDDAITSLMTMTAGDVTLHNLQIAQQMGESNTDHALLAEELRQLLGARVAVLSAKADLLKTLKGEQEAEFFDTNSRDLEVRCEETVELRDTYQQNFGGDVEQLSSKEAKIFKQ